MSEPKRGLIHYDIPLESGEVATIHVPLPETELDEWLVRRMIAFAVEIVDRITLEETPEQAEL